MDEREEYKRLIDDMTWSYSRLNSFLQCPYLFFCRYVAEEKSKKEDKFYASYGSLMHELLEMYYLFEVPKEDLLTDFFVGFYDRVSMNAAPKRNVVAERFASGKEYLKNLEPFPYKCIAVEQEIEFIMNGVKMIAKVDYIGEDENGELVIIDHKSADIKPRSNRKKPTVKDKELDEKLRQLYVYAYAVHEIYGKWPKYLCFNCFRTGTLIKEQFYEEKMLDCVDFVTKTVKKVLDCVNFYPNLDWFFCHYLCDMESECCYVS